MNTEQPSCRLCSILRTRTALQPLLQGKHRKHSTDLPTTSCKTESYGIRPKTWHQLSLRDKSRKLYSATNNKNRSKDPFCGIFAPIPIYTFCSFVPLKTVFNSSARLHFCCKSNKKLKNATKNKRMCNFSFAIQLLFVNLQPHKRKGNLQIPLQSV